MSDLPFKAVPDGIEIAIRLTPKGGRDRIEGVTEHDGQPCLKVRVSAPPIDGAANKALVAFLAKSLGVSRSSVTFLSGEKSRIKRLRIEGEGLSERLEALLKG
ncbi:DUF167 domain-containing protein [Amaricoccus macauensis]|uniref:DUF167 domain-containing protein n=1 Tax=Amaricoccus macauensis TaxID=57001 RepID=UPI003C7B06F7